MAMGNSIAMSSWKWLAKPNQTDSRDAAFREAHKVDSKVDHPMDADPKVVRHPKDADPKVDRHPKDADPKVDRHLKGADPKVDRHLKGADPKVDRHLKDADPKVDRHLKDADPKVDRHPKVGVQRECKLPIPSVLSTKPCDLIVMAMANSIEMS
jgi:hypothetical protein